MLWNIASRRMQKCPLMFSVSLDHGQCKEKSHAHQPRSVCTAYLHLPLSWSSLNFILAFFMQIMIEHLLSVRQCSQDADKMQSMELSYCRAQSINQTNGWPRLWMCFFFFFLPNSMLKFGPHVTVLRDDGDFERCLGCGGSGGLLLLSPQLQEFSWEWVLILQSHKSESVTARAGYYKAKTPSSSLSPTHTYLIFLFSALLWCKCEALTTFGTYSLHSDEPSKLYSL